MDQPLDFSFHKENPLAVADDVESPKPMPKPPALPIIPDIDANNVPDVKRNSLSPSDASEVIESLSISAAKSSDADKNEKNEIKDGTGLQDSASSSAPPVPKFPNEAQPSSPKPKPRAKVPLERGFTQVDWLKLTRTQPDLAGLKGGTNRRLIAMAEVKQHRTEGDAWTVLKGRVYNITPYLKFHPGGVDMLMKGSGKDCTALFNKYHSWVNAEYLLEKCLVGFFDPEH